MMNKGEYMFKVQELFENADGYEFDMLLPIILNILKKNEKKIIISAVSRTDIAICQAKLIQYHDSIIEYAVLAEYLKNEFCEIEKNGFITIVNYGLFIDVIYLLFLVPCKPLENVIQRELGIIPDLQYDIKTSARAYCAKRNALQYRNVLDLFFRIYTCKDYKTSIERMKKEKGEPA